MKLDFTYPKMHVTARKYISCRFGAAPSVRGEPHQNPPRAALWPPVIQPKDEPALMYGGDIWVPTKKVQTRIQSTEMNFLRKTKGCTKTRPYNK
jgi:hypothetical protein